MLLAVVIVGACGKKGNPLPPLQRIPSAPPDFSVTRVDNEVYVTFAVPHVNIDGVGPADVARVELYAITAERGPQLGEDLDAEDLRRASTLVASELVRRPLPPPPPVKEGFPPIPQPPPGPGVDQRAIVIMRETLGAEMQTPVALPEPRLLREAIVDVRRPLVAAVDGGGGPQRYYYAVAVSPRGRYGPPTAFVPAPLGPTSSAPPAPQVNVGETEVTVRWEPPPDSRGIVEPANPDWLPSRSLIPGPPPTTYDVYEVPRNIAPDAPLTVPTPLTPAPVGAREFTLPTATLGTERCFYVRAVDIVDGVHVRGPASPVVCADFADTFAPAPPSNLDAVAVPGAISLIWEPSAAADLAGYLVLRGDAGGATLTPLMKTPITDLSYRDDTVRGGSRYIYAVVAVDKAGNQSTESNRIEETARQ